MMPWVTALCAGGAVFLMTESVWMWWSCSRREQLARVLYFPGPIKNKKEKQRWWGRKDQQMAKQDLADFLDLFAMAVESGLPLGHAFQEAVALMPALGVKQRFNALSLAVEQGVPLAEALKSFSQKAFEPKEKFIFFLLLNALQTGAPLNTVLKNQASLLREQQTLFLEKQAQTAGIKLLFPIVFFLFPSLFIILFGALYLYIQNSGGF